MRKLTRNLVLAGIAGVTALSSVQALAADEPKPAPPSPHVGHVLPATPPPPEHVFTTNAAFVSNYIFRGLTQTFGKPAVQVGFDYAHSSGAYAGVWGSNISGQQYAGGRSAIDYYFGYNGKLAGDWGWTAGFYGYYYPGANYKNTVPTTADQEYNTEEVNAGVSWKWVSLKLSSTTGDYFGANTKTGYTSGSSGSTYLDLTANIPLSNDFTLLLHYGDQDVKTKLATANAAGATDPSYTDYKIGISKAFKDGWTVGLAYSKADNTKYYDKTAGVVDSSKTHDLGSGVTVLSISRVF